MTIREVPLWFVAGVACAAILLYVGFVLLGLPHRLKARYGHPVPEAGLYSVSSVDGFLSHLDREGVAMYRRQLVWDILFAIAFGTALGFLVIQAWVMWEPIGSDRPLYLALIPLAYVLFDILEDISLLVAVRSNNVCLPPPALRPPKMDYPDCERDRAACTVCAEQLVEHVIEELIEEAIDDLADRGGILVVEVVEPLSDSDTPGPAASTTSGIRSGTAVVVAMVWTVLKFAFVLLTGVALLLGLVLTIDSWPR